MRYTLGNNRVSDHQRRLIVEARNAIGEREKASILLRLLHLTDIETGAETISYEWVSICAHLQSATKTPSRSRRLQRFINAAEKLMHHSPEVEHLDVHKQRLVFLLGAGASRPHPTNIPTVNELLPNLLERARRLDRDDLTGLADFCDAHGIDHIEDLLTAAQLSHYCSRHPEVLRLVNFLLYGQRLNGNSRRTGSSARTTRGPSDNGGSVAFLADTLQVLFGLISGWMLPAPPNEAHHVLATYCLTHPNARLITTNYDCCMDRALQQRKMGVDYAIDFRNRDESGEIEPVETQLLKLHGSLNWFYCDTCQDVHIVPIANADQSFLATPSTRIPYPVIAHCDGCNGLRRPLLVPPQALKFDIGPPLNPLVELATAAFRDADVIVAVGFSFADSDVHITRALTRAMKVNRDSRLVVIDPNFDVRDRIARKLAIRIPNFDASRVMRIASSCTEVLRPFLAGDYYRLGDHESGPVPDHIDRPGLPVVG